MKLNYEDKISLYEERLSGKSISSLCEKYGINKSGCKYLCSLINRHGYSVLRTNKNQHYSAEFKQMLIDKVLLEGYSMHSISIEYGLKNIGTLSNWISEYKKNGYIVIEKPKGRPTMSQKPKKELTRLEQLEYENLYLRAENAYLKKLDALVRKNRLEEKKRQK